jgi:hypothetical protein
MILTSAAKPGNNGATIKPKIIPRDTAVHAVFTDVAEGMLSGWSANGKQFTDR